MALNSLTEELNTKHFNKESTYHQTSTGDAKEQTQQEAPQAPPPRIPLTNGGAAERLWFKFRQRFTETYQNLSLEPEERTAAG